MHEQGVRVQRLALTDVSAGAVVIGKAIKQVAMSGGLITPAVTRQPCHHLRNFCSGLVGFGGSPQEKGGRESAGKSVGSPFCSRICT